MANPAVDNQLQAIALGANLANQRRQAELMRQQLNMQAGAQLMRQRQMDMQLRAQEFEMSQAIREQEAQMRDMPKFQMFQNEAIAFRNDPTGKTPMPSMPYFESRGIAITAAQTLQGLEEYSARAQSVKAMNQAAIINEKLLTGKVSELNKMAMDLSDRGVKVPQYISLANGAPAIIPEAASFITDEHARVMGEESDRKAMADYSTMAAKGTLTEDQANQLLSEGKITREQHQNLVGAITSAGGPATQKERGIEAQIATLKQRGAIATPEDEVEARGLLFGPTDAIAGDTKLRSSFNTQLKSVRSLEAVRDMVAEFENKHGKGALKKFTGPLDSSVDAVTRRLKGYQQKGALTAEDVGRAQRIFNAISGVVADYRFGLFGASLTSGEKEAMEDLVSNRNRADYIDAIDNFRNTLEGGVRRYINEYKFSYLIPATAWKDYGPGGAETVTETVTEQPVPVPGQSQDGWGTTSSGVRFRVKQ